VSYISLDYDALAILAIIGGYLLYNDYARVRASSARLQIKIHRAVKISGKTVGLVLIFSSILLTGQLIQTYGLTVLSQAVYASSFNGGQGSRFCNDLTALLCPNGGNSGAISSTNSTICTSPTTSPCSPNCNGTFYSNWGRCEEGSASCTVPGGSVTCTTNTVIYPTSFTNPVVRSDISLTLAPIALSTVTKTIPSSYAQSNFLTVESAGQTWSNMPVAQTEFFGDTLGQHRTVVDWGNMTGVDFVVDCSVGSANANAVLDVQYSEDAGVTWTTVSGITVTVSNTLCGLGEPLDWGAEAGTCLTSSGFGCYQSIPAGARKQGTWLRVVGTSGNGAGDNPVFQQAYVITRTDSSTFTLGFSCTPTGTPSIAPKVSFQLAVACSIAPNSATSITVGWKVWVATG